MDAVSKVETVLEVQCRDCDWQPDPERRMSIDNQAQEHTRERHHVTVTYTRPIQT